VLHMFPRVTRWPADCCFHIPNMCFTGLRCARSRLFVRETLQASAHTASAHWADTGQQLSLCEGRKGTREVKESCDKNGGKNDPTEREK
jgi:hypothetical protein